MTVNGLAILPETVTEPSTSHSVTSGPTGICDQAFPPPGFITLPDPSLPGPVVATTVKPTKSVISPKLPDWRAASTDRPATESTLPVLIAPVAGKPENVAAAIAGAPPPPPHPPKIRASRAPPRITESLFICLFPIQAVVSSAPRRPFLDFGVVPIFRQQAAGGRRETSAHECAASARVACLTFMFDPKRNLPLAWSPTPNGTHGNTIETDAERHQELSAN